MTTFIGNVYTDNVADYTFNPSHEVAAVLELGESVEASEITVAPPGPGWWMSLLIQQAADDGDVAVTWANVTWFGGTPPVATGALAQTTVLLFSPDGVTIFGFGTAAAGGGSPLTPEAHSAIAAVGSVQNATTNASVPSVGYVQAEAASTATLANALKVNYNAAQLDIAALRTELLALQNQLIAAGVLT
jgi:hypothetical protein